MKLICTQENFKKAIYNCERAVAKRNTLPILNNILFETEKGGLKLSATNLEIGISSQIGAKIEREGKITVPARLISGLSNNLLKGDNIILESDGETLKIKNKTNKTSIKGIPAGDFPLIPVKKGEYLLELDGAEFKKAINRVLVAVAVNEARQELTGVNIKLKEKELFFAATDSFRLAEYKITLDEKDVNKETYPSFIEKNESVIVPASTLIEFNRIISEEEEFRVKIAIEEGQIFFEIGNVKLVSRLIDGKYPQYEYIMPKEYVTRIVGEKKFFQNALKTATLFSSGSSNEITLKIDAEASEIFIHSSGAETGENSTEIKFEITGPSQGIIFNAKYLLDGINAVSSDQVAILANSETSPVAIREIDDKTGEVLDNFIYLAMPIKN
ncbi:MAG: DNA polymerase III subunit beta [Parcubacteria group bacterium]